MLGEGFGGPWAQGVAPVVQGHRGEGGQPPPTLAGVEGWGEGVSALECRVSRMWRGPCGLEFGFDFWPILALILVLWGAVCREGRGDFLRDRV